MDRAELIEKLNETGGLEDYENVVERLGYEALSDAGLRELLAAHLRRCPGWSLTDRARSYQRNHPGSSWKDSVRAMLRGEL